MNFEVLSKLLDESLENKKVPCFDIAISKDNEIVYRYMGGTNDPYKKNPINGKELYFLYSASKPITCTAALQLYEKGKIDLDDYVYQYIPEYKNVKVMTEHGLADIQDHIKIKHLFTMTSGMGYDIASEQIKKQRDKKNDSNTIEFVKAMAGIPLSFEPGEHFKYGLSHDVLAAIVEIVSGLKFSDYLRKNVFDLCEMNDTYVGCSDEVKERICTQYTYVTSSNEIISIPKRNEYILSSQYESGGAGLVSCVDDYMKFAQEMVNSERLLKKETINLMRRNHLSPSAYIDFQDSKPGYSYGLGVRTNVNSGFSVKGEFGWDGAAGAYVIFDPNNRLAVFYITHVKNHGNYLYSTLHPQIRDAVYKCIGIDNV